MTKKTITSAIIQHPPVFLNLKESVELAMGYISEASSRGAGLIAFPETWLCGYPVWLDSAPEAAVWDNKASKELYGMQYDNALEIPGEGFAKLRKAATKAKAIVVIGATERQGGTLYNSMIFLSPEGTYVRRKLVPTHAERLIWGRGNGSTLDVFDSPFGKVGGLICWEHWMPALRIVMHEQNEYVHIAQWPTVHDVHLLASRQYAFEGRCYVLAAGMVLSQKDVLDGFDSLGTGKSAARDMLASMHTDEKGFLNRGGSVAIAPNSKLLSEQHFYEPGIIYADLDLQMIAEEKMALDCAGHYSRPDIFSLKVNRNQLNNIDIIDKH